MSSSGKHRRAPHHGEHRKPSRAKQYAASAGTVTAAGIIAAGLSAAPAGAAERVTHASSTEHLAHLHVLHLLHLEHLAHARHHWFTPRTEVAAAGIFSPSQIGALWLAAGGSPAAELTAECIAHFESGGNSRALSPTNDYGIWQINGSHGPAMATFDPMGNARAAIIISDNGRNWSQWTTHWHCGV